MLDVGCGALGFRAVDAPVSPLLLLITRNAKKHCRQQTSNFAPTVLLTDHIITISFPSPHLSADAKMPLRNIPKKRASGKNGSSTRASSISLPERIAYKSGGVDKVLDLSAYNTWTAEEVTTYMETLGIPIGNSFCQHKISGDVLHRLQMQHYTDMGIKCIGDILRLEEIVEYLRHQKRQLDSQQIIWESDEYRKDTCIERCICNWALCCFACRPKTDRYKLTSTTLHVKSKSPVSCCFCCEIEGAIAACIRGCCGTQWNTNSTELSVIRDIDVIETNVNCCDACCRIDGTEKVLIATSLQGEDQANIRLTLKIGEGSEFASIIRDTMNSATTARAAALHKTDVVI